MAMDEKFPLALPGGTILAGQYIIDKALGQGGFGITYRATDHKTNERVAVKEFFPDTLAYREMTTVISYPGERSENFVYGKESFLQEARTLAEFIGNENIVRIHSYFEENGTAYFVMDYIEGKSFDEYLKERGGKISVEEAKSILIPVMDALNAVHGKGIVHRDVTPDNIYITDDGTVKLLDFGAARYSLGDKSRSLDVILKHGFAPKEQYTRRGKQGPFTDIYSLAATFYFAITGKRPPDSVDRLDVDDLIPPSNLGVDITDYQEKAILQALSVQPADRFETMAVFKKVLLNENTTAQQTFLIQPVQSVQQVQPNQVLKPISEAGAADKAKKKKLIVGLSAAGAGIAAVAALVVGITLSGNKNISTSGNDWVENYPKDNGNASSGGGYDPGNYTTPSFETPETQILPEPEQQPEPETYSTDELCVVGTTAANIKNGGIFAAGGVWEFWTDKNSPALAMSDGTSVEWLQGSSDGGFSSLSYYDGILYYLYSGSAYMRNMADGSSAVIPELERYSGSIERLYVTTGCYFIYTFQRLYRISRKTGEEEDWIDLIRGDRNMTLDNGWLYFIDDDSTGKSAIFRVKADDFSQEAKGINISSGSFGEPVVDGNYIYLFNYDGETTSIFRFNSDLSDPADHVEWDITELRGPMGDVFDLNVIGNDLFFSAIPYGEYLLYHMTVDGGDYTYELVNSDYIGGTCITKFEDYYEIDYLAWDADTAKLDTFYNQYPY